MYGCMYACMYSIYLCPCSLDDIEYYIVIMLYKPFPLAEAPLRLGAQAENVVQAGAAIGPWRAPRAASTLIAPSSRARCVAAPHTSSLSLRPIPPATSGISALLCLVSLCVCGLPVALFSSLSLSYDTTTTPPPPRSSPASDALSLN